MAIPVGPEASVRITLSERARALFAVGAGSLVARMSPRRICNFLEWVGRKSDPADAVQAGRARYAVCAVSARCSGMGCLLRSVSAFIYCRCQGTSPDWCSGFRTSPFAAHAWIEVDGCPVGEPGSLSSFVTVLSVRPHRHDARDTGWVRGREPRSSAMGLWLVLPDVRLRTSWLDQAAFVGGHYQLRPVAGFKVLQ